MQQKELTQSIKNFEFLSIIVRHEHEHDAWCIYVEDRDNNLIGIRTARGGKRKFKTLDAVCSMLESVGVNFFEVYIK